MGKIEWCLLDSYKEDHAVITAAMSDFERIGYMVSGISYKNGALEVTCRPLGKKGGKDVSVSLSNSENQAKDQ
jgi:hypothetical protein